MILRNPGFVNNVCSFVLPQYTNCIIKFFVSCFHIFILYNSYIAIFLTRIHIKSALKVPKWDQQ